MLCHLLGPTVAHGGDALSYPKPREIMSAQRGAFSAMR